MRQQQQWQRTSRYGIPRRAGGRGAKPRRHPLPAHPWGFHDLIARQTKTITINHISHLAIRQRRSVEAGRGRSRFALEPHSGIGVDPGNAVGGSRLRTLKFGQLEKMRKDVELFFVDNGMALLLCRWTSEERKSADAQRCSNHSL